MPLKNMERRMTKNTTATIGSVSEPQTRIRYFVVAKKSSAWNRPDDASPKLSLSALARSRGMNFGANLIPHFLRFMRYGKRESAPERPAKAVPSEIPLIPSSGRPQLPEHSPYESTTLTTTCVQ